MLARHAAPLAAALILPLAIAAPAAAQSPVLSAQFTFEHAPYAQVHASTLVETRAGTLLAAWFGGTHEKHPDVSIYLARYQDGEWRPARLVADGVQPDGKRHPTWNPVLFQPKDGPLILYYKVGPDPETWWGMEMTSNDDGRTWSKPRRLPDGILGPIKNKPVELADGSWLSPTSAEAPGRKWTLHFERSADRGRTWQATAPVESPEGIMAIQPSILFHKDGQLQAIARTRQGALGVTWSKDGGRHWGPLMAVDLPSNNSGTDAVTLRDGRQLIVYNHTAHHPSRLGKGGVRYPINVALSDDGLSWRKVVTLESAVLPAGYAYPAVIQTRDGRVHISYTWDRRRIRHVVIDPARLPRGDSADTPLAVPANPPPPATVYVP
ncbi:sialidase family protein [Sphingomonas turrisvirgatae]|uniref:Sialidase n=1 Tax=Sphingomonas turrisvirgatae TaxID=1888892 RepID=A0A1E3M0I1_9SPHN|nr:sialidase family protein [Sphingomonas turrisvirgatae]ODP39524.1 sialidase [Sphingomonas turrisvirgatae]